MIFSKSFGYAVRGILYIAWKQKEACNVQAAEIATSLGVPRHFMSKILKRLAKSQVLLSIKGPAGGFTLHQHTLSIPLIDIVNITDGLLGFKNCVLRLEACNEENPCPLHSQMQGLKHHLRTLLTNTTIGDMLHEDNARFVDSIAAGDLSSLLVTH